MPRNCALRRTWWWPLALAAFALSALVAIGLGAGTAHADDGSASAGDSQSAVSPTSSVHSSAIAARRAARAAARSADSSTTPVVGKSRTARPVAIVRHRPAATSKAGVSKAGVSKAGVSKAALSTAQASQPTGAATRSTTTAPRHPKVAQFLRQVVGAASDAGIVSASFVNDVAAHTAAAIGPKPFFGVPYAVATVIAHTAANVSKVLCGTPLDATSTGPFAVDYGVLDALSFFNPSKVPAGANDPSIKISTEHPLPIILVNGTVETQNLNWSVGAPVLANAGYMVYTFNYGNVTRFPNFPIQSTADIRVSAAELSDEIAMVLADTGASQVILVGHSQGGGIMPAYYINDMDGAATVAQFIGLAPSNHGTNFDGLAGLLKLPIVGPLLKAVSNLFGPALLQQVVGSPFQQVVYGGGDTRAGVVYTTIASTNDEVVTPYTQQALDGRDVSKVTNIVLQDQYPGLPTGHVGVAFSSRAWADVLSALASNAQASPVPIAA